MATLVDPTSNEWKYSKLSSAAIVGATTTDSARIWVRVYMSGDWWLVVSETPLSGDLMRLDEKSVPDFVADEAIDVIYQAKQSFTDDTNLTAVFDIAGLDPDVRYYYAIIADEMDAAVVPRRTELGINAPLCFRTIPQSSRELVFGFYSCHDPISGYGPGAWPHFFQRLQETRAHFVIGGGDQVYVDTNDRAGFPDIWMWLRNNRVALLETYDLGNGQYDEHAIEEYLLNVYRWYYRVYWSEPALREVYEGFPQYMIWDDHEIMDGWGSRTVKERLSKVRYAFEGSHSAGNSMLVNRMWRAACRAYYEYEHSHNPPTDVNRDDPDACVWDYSFRHQDTAFYVLDMRGHHDVEKVGDPHIILGSGQFKRFTDWLNGPDVESARALFVVSPVPIVHWDDNWVNRMDIGPAKDDFMDEWGHDTNREERNELLEALFTRVNGTGQIVTFLSGDVHCASVFRILHDRFPDAKLFQVTSSAISRQPAPGALMVRIAESGPMRGNDDVQVDRLYALTGNKNFLIVRVPEQDGHADTRVHVELNWPGGDDGEVTTKTIVLA